MATFSEILQIEKKRSDAKDWNVIHLFKEGNFYRAYEWSAWLIATVAYSDEARKETPDRKPLTVSRKKIKSGDGDYTFVGFPLKSIEKFIPHHTAFIPVNDSQIDVSIELPATKDELSAVVLEQAFSSWKQQFPISEDSAKKEGGHQAGSARGLTAIMSQILSYPLESKTPMDNTAFISAMKKQLAALL